MMKRVAITGGIGSGKSAVTAILRSLGAKVIVADEINARLLNDPEYIEHIRNRFPCAVHNNVINRKELADIVYHDEAKREELMSLAHPRIFKRMFEEGVCSELSFYEIPLFTKTPFSFDEIWFVNAPMPLRVERIVHRDKVTEDLAKRVIDLQEGESVLLEKADFVIENVGNLDALRESVKGRYYSILKQLS